MSFIALKPPIIVSICGEQKIKYLLTDNLKKKKKMSTLSEAELARIARNREKAQNLRSARLCQRPYSRPENDASDDKKKNQTTNKR